MNNLWIQNKTPSPCALINLKPNTSTNEGFHNLCLCASHKKRFLVYSIKMLSIMGRTELNHKAAEIVISANRLKTIDSKDLQKKHSVARWHEKKVVYEGKGSMRTKEMTEKITFTWNTFFMLYPYSQRVRVNVWMRNTWIFWICIWNWNEWQRCVNVVFHWLRLLILSSLLLCVDCKAHWQHFFFQLALLAIF